MLLAIALAGGSALADLEHLLEAQDSATAALGAWCAARHLADPPAITATLVKGADALPPPDLDDTLQLGEQQEAGYRHVRLACGSTVLSEAHNWYAPQRLTATMKHTLDSTDTPFGKAVAELRFHRERLGMIHGAAAGCPASTVLSHRALLRLPDGAPLALVVECYTPAAIAH